VKEAVVKEKVTCDLKLVIFELKGKFKTVKKGRRVSSSGSSW
jgi:hypothetical protein